MSVWNLRGTEPQNTLVRESLAACDFPFDELLPSLQREGKTSIAVDWADLSRFADSAEKAAGDRVPISADSTVGFESMISTGDDTCWMRATVDGRPDLSAESDRVPRREADSARLADQAQTRLLEKVRPAGEETGHDHDHPHEHGVHTITREVDGRERVLGLFYLPPYTRVVLDLGLEARPMLAREVFLAEGAHAVDYHYMVDKALRDEVWNALHAGTDHDVDHVSESGDLGHGHSWFDGPGGYSTWVGEAFMEAFTRAFAPSVPVTIQLAHPVSTEAAAAIRAALLAPLAPPEPEPDAPPPAGRVYRGRRKHVVHDSHVGVEPVEWFDSLAEAQAAGLRGCKVCRPA